jgi:hypothetical protein
VAFFFAVTLFVSAFLLFLVQPMVGKMVLPLLGGAPAAWATCMVFFQALLLAGYAYAHAAVRRLGSRRQAIIHIALLVLPLIVLGVTAAVTGSPIRAYKSLAPQGETQPFFGAIALLAAAVGLPFFVVSTSAPLLQRWFADTDHPAAQDPYFLYAASNVGSLLALVAYPFLVEPRFPLAAQGWLWSGGYLLLVGLTAGCAWRLQRTVSAALAEPKNQRGTSQESSLPPGLGPNKSSDAPSPALRNGQNPRLRWLALAFVPSSLLLSVTQFITTDIAPVPGLWVLPLAIYLLTFIIAFGRTPTWVKTFVALVTPIAVLMTLFVLLTDRKPESLAIVLSMHLLVFLLVALNCHIDLANRRPEAGRLTEFFLWVSLGGVLGGLFNSLIAPLIFTELNEYPLALIAACFLQPAVVAGGQSRRVLDIVIPLVIAGVTVALFLTPTDWMPLVATLPVPTTTAPFYRWANVMPYRLWTWALYGLPLLVSYAWVDRPIRFGLCVGAVWLTLTFCGEGELRHGGRLLRRDRSFFGVLAVTVDVDKASTSDREVIKLPGGDVPMFHRLVHGTTLHGLQQWEPRSDEPLTYYHRTGPIGQVFLANPPALKHGRFAFVGLGAGSLSAYGKPGQSMTFFEIDPAVRRIAEDRQYFTYLHDCKADLQFVMGDARLKLEDYTGPKYGLIVVDAFSSDAIPIHLLTKEALQLYLDKLTDDGIIALHLSNRYLHLEQVAARLVEEQRRQNPDMAALMQWDYVDRFDPQDDLSPSNFIPGKRASQWVIIARSDKYLDAVRDRPNQLAFGGRSVTLSRWEKLEASPGAPLWTDDFSNLTDILNWEEVLPRESKQ